MRFGILVLHLGHEMRFYNPRLHPELSDQPGVLRTAVRDVVWRRGSPQVWM